MAKKKVPEKTAIQLAEEAEAAYLRSMARFDAEMEMSMMELRQQQAAPIPDMQNALANKLSAKQGKDAITIEFCIWLQKNFDELMETPNA